jgi:hypothetical protein
MGLIQINHHPSKRDLRLFGLLWFPLFYGLVGALVLLRSPFPQAAWWIWGAGVVLSLVGSRVPPVMRVVFVGLSYAAFPIGWTVSHTMLLFLYYVVLTPIGLALRLFGHDAMKRRLDPKRTTLWEPVESERELGRYFRQT